MTINRGCIISPCTCKHDGQDKLFGQGKRLHNRCNNTNKEPMKGARCTVCGKVKFI